MKWRIVFCLEKYDYVGRLLKPGQTPNNYSDEEEEVSTTETQEKSKDNWESSMLIIIDSGLEDYHGDGLKIYCKHHKFLCCANITLR